MGIFLGIDIGAISIKLAGIGEQEDQTIINELVGKGGSFYIPRDNKDNLYFQHPGIPFFISCYRRIKGKPTVAVYDLLEELLHTVPQELIEGVRVCGSGSRLIGSLLNTTFENEFKATAKGFEFLYPQVKTVFEMGGTSSKYIKLEQDDYSGDIGISDYEKSGDCAAGTGSFLDQQASRLKYEVNAIGKIVLTAVKSAKIAGRCSVFAKSDMIHAQQKGYAPPEVLKGLCEAVARNYKGSITKGKTITPPVAFIGGVAANQGVVQALGTIFKLKKNDLFVPVYYASLAAIGAALIEKKSVKTTHLANINNLVFSENDNLDSFPVNKQLTLEKVILLRNRVKSYEPDKNNKRTDAYLGIDIGSVSTNLAVIDKDGNVMKEIYMKTDGRPIEVVNNGLHKISGELSKSIEIKGVATTGSGRELIGELIGADTINDEITAHKTGADFIGKNLLNKKVDTIFEIGGQDSKFISLDDGIVVDFAMNEACAAGTGSFLEERAEELEINIINEFAKLALKSENPIKLGERCTVFMERDVNAYQQKGAAKEDLVAGLAYSVAYNYLNRVVKGRRIGEVIFFQGGTAYNDAVAAAFSKILDRPIIVPPHNGVLGAIGAALLAKDKMKARKKPTGFRGYRLEQVEYQLKEFTCKACSNYCNMQEFTVEGEKTYWGDQCSDKFRKRKKSEKTAVIPDLLELRKKLLLKDYNPGQKGKYSVGLPRTIYTYDFFPFWNSLFTELGCSIHLSTETNRKVINDGIDAVVAEPCFPIKVAHGHVAELLENNIDYIFIPNIIDVETKFKTVNSYMCPWGQTLPFIISQSPKFEPYRSKFIIPTISFRRGINVVLNSLHPKLKKLGFSKGETKNALEKAYIKQQEFNINLKLLGQKHLTTLIDSNEPGIILVGRSYNIYDKSINLDIGGKMRDFYGVNIIPMDFLDIDEIPIDEINDNMFWNYGRKIIAAGKFARHYDNLHIIYITNFKCGPDSYIKHFITDAANKPYLSLQFDGHSNDAGFMTRCEAYLDSKGVLKY